METEATKKKRIHFRIEQLVVGGFAMVILLGAVLLMLPVSWAEGVTTHWSDALFTATTAVCVTGLVTVTTATNWSIFGKVVILILIQFGGLGIIACAVGTMLLVKRRVSMSARKIIAESYNLDSMSGVLGVLTRIVKGIAIVETLGVIPYAVVFIPQYGLPGGLGRAVFNSVSCFCNAGMDILGEDSLAYWVTDPIININTILLILVGSIGFFVWFDLIDTAKKIAKGKNKAKGFVNSLSVHTRLAITTSLILVIGGAFLIALFDWNNPASLGELKGGQKIMAALFQSVTTRTAGFQTIPQQNFTDASSFLCLILMFIGGSPLGTAGGMKTTTIAIVILATWSYLKGQESTELYCRRLRASDIRTAMVVLALGVAIALLGVISLSAATGASAMDVLYEVISAVGTVGLTRGLTPGLNMAGKLIIIVIMFCGRIGPVTPAMAVTLRTKAAKKQIHFPEEKILIG